MSAATVTGGPGVERVPEEIRSRVTLDRVDYADLFVVSTGAATDSPEEWARAVLEGAPVSRRSARRLWRSLGLRLGPAGSAEHVQGWRIAARGEDWIRLETSSWYVSAEAVCRCSDGAFSVSLFLRYDHPIAALVWKAVGPVHERAVPVMLRQGSGVLHAARDRAWSQPATPVGGVRAASGGLLPDDATE